MNTTLSMENLNAGLFNLHIENRSQFSLKLGAWFSRTRFYLDYSLRNQKYKCDSCFHQEIKKVCQVEIQLKISFAKM